MGREAGATLNVGVYHRWQKGTRYYEVRLHQDLWSDWIVTQVWGRRGSPLGQVRHQPCESYTEGLNQVQQVQQRRTQRGYAPVGDVTLPALTTVGTG